MMNENGVLSNVRKTIGRTVKGVGDALGLNADEHQLYKTLGEEDENKRTWNRYRQFSRMLSMPPGAVSLNNKEANEWLDGRWRRYSLSYHLDWGTKFKGDKSLVFHPSGGSDTKHILFGECFIQPNLYGSEITEALHFLADFHSRDWRPDGRGLLKVLDDVINQPGEQTYPIPTRYLGKSSGIFLSITMFEKLMAVYAVMAMADKRPCQLEDVVGVTLAGAIVEPSRVLEDPQRLRRLLMKDYILDQADDLTLGGFAIPGIAPNVDQEEDREPVLFAAVVISARMLRELHELYVKVFPTSLPQSVIENCPDKWVEYLVDHMWKDLVPDGSDSLPKHPSNDVPFNDGVFDFPTVPEEERKAFTAGYEQWKRYDFRTFVFVTDAHQTRAGVQPYNSRMIPGNAGGTVAYTYQTAFQIFWDEHGQFLRKVVGFLRNPNSPPKQSYQPMAEALTQGETPKEALSRVRQGTDNLGYFMSMPLYKDLLAMMSWISDTFGLPPQVEKLLKVGGLGADSAKDIRHRMLKDIRHQNTNKKMMAGVCGIAVAASAGERISLTGVIIPTRKMRLLKEALLSRFPDFFDRVRVEDIPEGPGTAWMDYLMQALSDAAEAETVTPAEEIPAALTTPEDVPIKDIFNRLFEDDDLRQKRRDALMKGLETTVLNEPEMVPVEEPVKEELPTEAEPVQAVEAIEPDVAEVETSTERTVRQRREKLAKLKPEAILAGMDADTLWNEVLTNPLGYFACEVEGPARMTPELRTLVREGKAETAGDGKTTRTPRAVELETAVTHSKLAVMEWSHFTSTVDSRRHPAMRWLEGLLGRKLNFHKADVVDITPDRIGELPGLVAGLHRNYPDRLCVVRVVMRHKVTRYTCTERAERRLKRRGKSPLVIKTRQISATRLHRQKFQFAEVPMLAVFPAGWMAPVTEPWMPGLFGTPYDPTLLDFCDTMPATWWAELAKVIPSQDTTRPQLDIRALKP